MLPTPLRLVLPALLAASAAFADRVVSSFGYPTTDSFLVRRVYGAGAFANGSSTASLSTVDGALLLEATLVSDSGLAHSAQAGFRIPVHLLGPSADLRHATAIRFRLKGSGTFDADLRLDAKAYAANPGGQAEVASLRVTPDWQEITLPLTSDKFRLPCAATAEGCDAITWPGRIRLDSTQPDYPNPDRNAALAVEALRFTLAPRTTEPRTEPDSASLWLDDLVVLGMPKHPEVHGQGCRKNGPSEVFSTNKEPTNQVGAYWYAFTDTGAAGLAKGTSSLLLPGGAKRWKVDTANAAITLIADLSRTSTSTRAGFAAAGSQVAGYEYQLDLTGMTSIGFTLSVPDGATLDPVTVEGIKFQFGTSTVNPDAWHSIMIPASQIAAGRTEICIDVDMLRMPEALVSAPQSPLLPLQDSYEMRWELRIQDSTGIITSAPHQGFSMGPIQVYGIDSFPEPMCAGLAPVDPVSCARYLACDPGCGPPSFPSLQVQPAAKDRSTATYRDGILSLRGWDAYPTIDIVSLSGRRVASLPQSPEVRIRLDRGAYLLVARAPGRPAIARTLAVAK